MNYRFGTGREEWIGFFVSSLTISILLGVVSYFGLEFSEFSREGFILAVGLFCSFGAFFCSGVVRRRKYEVTLNEREIVETGMFRSRTVLRDEVGGVRCVIFAATEAAAKDRVEFRLKDGSVIHFGKRLGKESVKEVVATFAGGDQRVDQGSWIDLESR